MKNQKHKKTVLVGLSGGVDSAVAALLLKQKGYNIIAAFMINFSETKNKLTGDCNYLQDKKDAQKIAAILKIPLKILNFEKEYKTMVISPMFKSYSKGLTPNPDSLCNKLIKFPLLWKYAKSIKADYIATGHYIKKVKRRAKYSLKIPEDKTKDQSYFLYNLTQADLKHTLFPLADLTKTEVRKIARKNKFPNYDKKSTRGICFVGKIAMKPFLKQKIKPKKGKILDIKNNVIGSHPGVFFYTIGERVKDKDFILSREFRNKAKSKLYIAEKNNAKNIIIVAPKNHKALKRKQFIIKKINFISKKQKFPLKCKVRIRHLGSLIPASLLHKSKKCICILSKPIESIAPGQSAVFYKNNFILGGGEIQS